jgi:hypothetical protein
MPLVRQVAMTGTARGGARDAGNVHCEPRRVLHGAGPAPGVTYHGPLSPKEAATKTACTTVGANVGYLQPHVARVIAPAGNSFEVSNEQRLHQFGGTILAPLTCCNLQDSLARFQNTAARLVSTICTNAKRDPYT